MMVVRGDIYAMPYQIPTFPYWIIFCPQPTEFPTGEWMDVFYSWLTLQLHKYLFISNRFIGLNKNERKS